MIGEREPHAGRIRVSLDGHTRTINLASHQTKLRQVLFLARPRPGRHRLTMRVLAIEGFAIGPRRS